MYLNADFVNFPICIHPSRKVLEYCLFTLDCGKPLEPDHGSVNISKGTAVGNTATFDCDTGYTLQGNRQTTCLKGNTWDHSTPKCIINGEKQCQKFCFCS